MNDTITSKDIGGNVLDAPRLSYRNHSENILVSQGGVKVKICGLTRPQDIRAVNAALPDYIGFVFAESRRRVSEEQAKTFKTLLDTRIKAVGVFVNAPVEQVARLCEERVIDIAQLHGDEDEAYIRTLRQLTKVPVIKAVRVRSAKGVLAAQLLPCDYLLLDTYTPHACGGSGETFNYALIPPLTKPFFLAGGLNIQTLPVALAQSPFGVDISSGAEANRVKDSRKITELVAMVRRHG